MKKIILSIILCAALAGCLLALGACSAVGGDPARDGFGLVAFVAMTPLITIQVLGLLYKIKLSRIKKTASKAETTAEEIID